MDAAHTPDSTCEIAVIGGGVAGLAAALLLARARRDVVVIDSCEPRNQIAAHTRGFITRDASTPTELLRLARAEAVAYGARIWDGDVVRLDADRTVHLADGRRVRAQRVLLTTGITDELPDIPGLRQRWGRDVLHCAYCHGYEAGQGAYVVLGTHPNAVNQAFVLKQWSPRITLATHEVELTREQWIALNAWGVRVVEGPVRDVVVERDQLIGVHVGETLVPATAVFLFTHQQPRDQFAQELPLERNEQGFVITDASGRTSVPWLYAAGNGADPRSQALTAAGRGQQVAHALHDEWVMDEVEEALAETRRMLP